LAGLLIAAAAAGPARANLVLNPGFEADDTSQGAVSPPTGWAVSGTAGADGNNPYDGTGDGFVGTGTLSQALTVIPGATYTVSFWADVTDGTLAFDSNATFDASFAGTTLIGGPIQAAALFGTYQPFTDTVTATEPNAVLSFTGVTSPGDGVFYLDDVDVALATASVTLAPEPWSVLLLAPGMAALRLLRRRVV